MSKEREALDSVNRSNNQSMGKSNQVGTINQSTAELHGYICSNAYGSFELCRSWLFHFSWLRVCFWYSRPCSELFRSRKFWGVGGGVYSMRQPGTVDLIDRLLDCLIDRLIAWSVDWLIDWFFSLFLPAMDAAAVGLHDLHWDIFISYILPVLSFADCCNLLIVLYGSSFNQTELEAFLAGQDLDAFWKAKFQSLDGSPRVSWGDLERVLPSLCSTPLLYRGQSTLLRDLPWYHRAKIRHETVQDLRKTVAHVRREKLLHLLTRRFPDAEAGFLSEFLASDPTDIRYPRRDHAGGSIHDSDRSGRAVPHFSVGNIRGGGGGGGGAAAHGLEYGEPAATFTRHYHEETGLWRGTGWLHEVLGPYFDGATSRDLEPGRPCNEIMCPLFAVADGLVMCNMREPFDVTANEVFAFGKEDGLRFLARDTPAKPHSLPLGTPLLRAGVWRTRELGPVARPQKRQDPTDMSILPVGSLVRYRTLVLVGAGEKVRTASGATLLTNVPLSINQSINQSIGLVIKCRMK